jgi:hypothetical protein
MYFLDPHILTKRTFRLASLKQHTISVLPLLDPRASQIGIKLALPMSSVCWHRHTPDACPSTQLTTLIIRLNRLTNVHEIWYEHHAKSHLTFTAFNLLPSLTPTQQPSKVHKWNNINSKTAALQSSDVEQH